MTRRTWFTLMVAFTVAGLYWLLDPAAGGIQIVAGWLMVAAAAVTANCRVWPATDDDEATP